MMIHHLKAFSEEGGTGLKPTLLFISQPALESQFRDAGFVQIA